MTNDSKHFETINEVFDMLETASKYSLASEVMLSFVYAIRQQMSVSKAISYALSEWDL